jgi:D-alanyl-D-alanine carboxypeptidase/D-alanyl-D-alanine-endopeptidase (penicillin-binding protein 4)
MFGLAAGVIALIIVAAGLVVLRPWKSATTGAAGPTATGPAQTSQAPLAPVLSGAGTDLPEPTAEAVTAALQPLMGAAALGSHVTAQVVDVASGTELYTRGPTQATTPASTMKLATAVAALAMRGPAYQIPTRVVAGANPGEVVLIGGGDPTLAATGTPTYPGAAKLSDLATQVKKALNGVAPTKVIVDSSLFSGPTAGPQWDPVDISDGQVSNITALMTDGGRTNPKRSGSPSPRYTSPDLGAGQAFAKLLGLPAAAVARGRAPGADGAAASGAPAPGTQLGQVLSPPLVRILEVMLNTSDNVVAEMMARQVALASNQPASFAGGSAAVLATLIRLGVPTGGARIYDGSGLSDANKLTPQLLTGILATAAQADHPALHGLFTGLPVAGYSGTLQNRYHTSGSGTGAGVVRAKTGTLNGVSCLAGLVVTASGRLLAFAVMADHVAGGSFGAEAALDKIAAALATVT